MHRLGRAALVVTGIAMFGGSIVLFCVPWVAWLIGIPVIVTWPFVITGLLGLSLIFYGMRKRDDA